MGMDHYIKREDTRMEKVTCTRKIVIRFENGKLKCNELNGSLGTYRRENCFKGDTRDESWTGRGEGPRSLLSLQESSFHGTYSWT